MTTTDSRKSARSAGGGPEPRHPDVSFDATEVKPGAVVAFLVYLGLAIVVALLVVWWSLALIESRVARFDRPPSPLRAGAKEPQPPEPRLQGVPGHSSDPQQDLRDYLNEMQKELNSYGWVDEKASVARIPIDDAMRIIAEKGLPPGETRPAAKTLEKK